MVSPPKIVGGRPNAAERSEYWPMKGIREYISISTRQPAPSKACANLRATVEETTSQSSHGMAACITGFSEAQRMAILQSSENAQSLFRAANVNATRLAKSQTGFRGAAFNPIWVSWSGSSPGYRSG